MKNLKSFNEFVNEMFLFTESVNEGKKYEEVEWIAPTKTFDYFGTKMTIKKGEKGLLISYESDEQYLVDFQDMRFYAMDGHQVKKTGNSITESVNEGNMNESLNESKNIKWKPSRNTSVEGFTSKSYPYNKGDGDGYVKQDKLHKKWKTRLESWLGFEVDFPLDVNFFPDMLMDFKFTDKEDITYRVYQSGEGSKSMQFVVQKFKKGVKESENVNEQFVLLRSQDINEAMSKSQLDKEIQAIKNDLAPEGMGSAEKFDMADSILDDSEFLNAIKKHYNPSEPQEWLASRI